MADLNNISLTGRLGQDAELRFTNDGLEILTISVGNGIYKKGAGDYNTQTTWYRCSIIGKRAKSLYDLNALVKGAMVGITGQHSIRTYNDKDGNERYSNEINNCEVTLMGGKPADANERPAAPQQAAKPTQTRQPARNVAQTVDDGSDTLPF
jgi:single-strand DNA-binding protein